GSRRFRCATSANRSRQGPGPCVLGLGGSAPADIRPRMGGRKRLEVPPCRRLFPWRRLNVPRKPCGHLEPWWSRTIAAVRRSAIDSTWLQPTGRFQCRVALSVNRRPPAIRFARCKFARVARFVQAFDQAIHPTEAQRLIECVQVRYRSHARVSLIEDEPHLGLGVVVVVEPFAPLVSGLSDECLHGLRSVLRSGSTTCWRASRLFWT